MINFKTECAIWSKNWLNNKKGVFMRKKLTREQLIARLDAKLERRKVQNETRSLERKVANEAMKEYGKGLRI